jgi:hypothetical protein
VLRLALLIMLRGEARCVDGVPAAVEPQSKRQRHYRNAARTAPGRLDGY